MAWDYAELSKAAKAAGGPEKLVDLIEESAKTVGRAEGQASMVPWFGLAVVGTSALTVGIMKLINHFKAKRAISQTVVNEAKAELIQGIIDYDANHLEEDNAKAKREEKPDE